MNNGIQQISREKSNKDYVKSSLEDFFKKPTIGWRTSGLVSGGHIHIVQHKGLEKHLQALLFDSTISVEIVKNHKVKLPSIFKDLKNEIEESKYILDLPNNWDDEGSLPYKKRVYIDAIKFLINYASHIWYEIGIIIDTPDIFHGPEGSIDLLWDQKKYKLLVNIPEKSQLGSFYGYDSKKQTEIKGKFNYKDKNFNVGLILWLKQIENA